MQAQRMKANPTLHHLRKLLDETNPLRKNLTENTKKWHLLDPAAATLLQDANNIHSIESFQRTYERYLEQLALMHSMRKEVILFFNLMNLIKAYFSQLQQNAITAAEKAELLPYANRIKTLSQKSVDSIPPWQLEQISKEAQIKSFNVNEFNEVVNTHEQRLKQIENIIAEKALQYDSEKVFTQSQDASQYYKNYENNCKIASSLIIKLNEMIIAIKQIKKNEIKTISRQFNDYFTLINQERLVLAEKETNISINSVLNQITNNNEAESLTNPWINRVEEFNNYYENLQHFQKELLKLHYTLGDQEITIDSEILLKNSTVRQNIQFNLKLLEEQLASLSSAKIQNLIDQQKCLKKWVDEQNNTEKSPELIHTIKQYATNKQFSTKQINMKLIAARRTVLTKSINDLHDNKFDYILKNSDKIISHLKESAALHAPKNNYEEQFVSLEAKINFAHTINELPAIKEEINIIRSQFADFIKANQNFTDFQQTLKFYLSNFKDASQELKRFVPELFHYYNDHLENSCLTEITAEVNKLSVLSATTKQPEYTAIAELQNTLSQLAYLQNLINQKENKIIARMQYTQAQIANAKELISSPNILHSVFDNHHLNAQFQKANHCSEVIAEVDALENLLSNYQQNKINTTRIILNVRNQIYHIKKIPENDIDQIKKQSLITALEDKINQHLLAVSNTYKSIDMINDTINKGKQTIENLSTNEINSIIASTKQTHFNLKNHIYAIKKLISSDPSEIKQINAQQATDLMTAIKAKQADIKIITEITSKQLANIEVISSWCQKHQLYIPKHSQLIAYLHKQLAISETILNKSQNHISFLEKHLIDLNEKEFITIENQINTKLSIYKQHISFVNLINEYKKIDPNIISHKKWKETITQHNQFLLTIEAEINKLNQFTLINNNSNVLIEINRRKNQLANQLNDIQQELKVISKSHQPAIQNNVASGLKEPTVLDLENQTLRRIILNKKIPLVQHRTQAQFDLINRMGTYLENNIVLAQALAKIGVYLTAKELQLVNQENHQRVYHNSFRNPYISKIAEGKPIRSIKARGSSLPGSKLFGRLSTAAAIQELNKTVEHPVNLAMMQHLLKQIGLSATAEQLQMIKHENAKLRSNKSSPFNRHSPPLDHIFESHSLKPTNHFIAVTAIRMKLFQFAHFITNNLKKVIKATHLKKQKEHQQQFALFHQKKPNQNENTQPTLNNQLRND